MLRFSTATLLALLAAAPYAQTCAPPTTIAGDTNVGLGIKYRAAIETGTVASNGTLVPSEPATAVPQHEYQLNLGYDRQDRLIARKSVTTPATDGSTLTLGTYRNIRSLHTIGNQLVTDDNGCQYLGASPDNQQGGNPIDVLATSGSVTKGLVVGSSAELQALGTATPIGTNRMRVAQRVANVPGAPNLTADIVREYQLQGANWVLSTATITTVSTLVANGRTEYFKNTSTHDFTLLAQAINAANEKRRAQSALNVSQRPSVNGAAARNAPFRIALPSLPVLHAAAQPGQNMVLQHGIFSSAGTWDRMDGWLQPRYQLGNTLIPSLVSTEPLATQRDNLIGLLSLTGARDNVMIGHSNGGLVVRSLAQTRPDLVRGVITNSTLHNGAILARALRTEAARGIGSIAAHVGANCRTPLDSVTCFLSAVLQDPFVNLGIANAAFDAAIPVTRDMQPQSAFIQSINATPEAFPRVSIENKADPRWVVKSEKTGKRAAQSIRGSASEGSPCDHRLSPLSFDFVPTSLTFPSQALRPPRLSPGDSVDGSFASLARPRASLLAPCPVRR